ncbi:MAG: putative esterase, partial [Actinomycetia bacterium]|nr:putative esterase [Actinomycetes bacterium]
MALITNVIKGSDAKRLLLLVHGYGADERDLGGILPYLDPDGTFAVVLPRGPIAVPGTPGFAWYDFGAENPEAAFNAAVDELDDLLDTACEEQGFAREEAVVGGFSQGAGVTLALALRASDRPRPLAVLAMSPALPGPIDVRARVPVLVQHGTYDPLVPVQRSRDLARTLRKQGVPTVYREYRMEHQVARESLQDARAWLERLFAGEMPDEEVPEDPIELVPPVT